MVKLVAFDWNGTLIADTEHVLKASNEVIRSLKGEKITMEIYREKFTMPIADFYVSLGYSRDLILEKIEENSAVFHGSYEKFILKARSRVGAKETLEYLKKKKIKCVIFSNHHTKGIKEQLKRLKLSTFIDEVIANDNTYTSVKERNKKENLKKYLRENKIKPTEAIIVGDAPEEVEIGKSLGLTSVAITEGNYSTRRLKEEKPDYLIKNLRQVIKVVEELC